MTERPSQWIELCTVSHARLVAAIAGLTDDDLRRTSRLPEWSVGHVLAHLARNADSHRGMFEAAARGEEAAQYPGGAAERDADIEAGAGGPARELLADVAGTATALEVAWEALPAAAWGLEGHTLVGPKPMAELVFRRLREVEVHRADLALGYDADDWPEAYVEEELRRLVPRLGQRAPAAAVVAFLMGRAPAPELGPWAD